MTKRKKCDTLAEAKYQVIFGIKKQTFDEMYAELEREYKEIRKRGGHKSQLSVLDKLVIMLGYYHDYRTMENIAFDYGVHKQRISDAVAWVEKTLEKSGLYELPGEKSLIKPENNISIVIADVTECETDIFEET